jgi:hypothetical protein
VPTCRLVPSATSSTTARSDCRSAAHHFPGSPVIGEHRFPPPRRRRGRDGSPQFPGRLSVRSTPNTPEGPSAPAPGSQTLSMAFAVREPARHPLPRPNRTSRLTTLTQASLTLQTARSPPAPLRTRPLDHARGHRYQGPGRLPGPDSHRQATLNLSLGSNS